MQHAVHLQSKFGCTPQGHKPGVAGVRGTAWPTTDCTWTAPPVGTLQITGQTRLSQPIYDPSLAAWCVHTADHRAGTAGVRGARRLGLHPALHDVPRGWHLLCRGARLGKAADRLDRPLPSRVCACVCVCVCALLTSFIHLMPFNAFHAIPFAGGTQPASWHDANASAWGGGAHRMRTAWTQLRARRRRAPSTCGRTRCVL